VRASVLAFALLAHLGCALAHQDAAPPAVPAAWPYPLDAKAASGTHGMVVTDAPLATEVGVRVLRDGGNAVDAAVAVAFALAVVLPSAGNLGGGGFLVTHLEGQDYALDFRETAPGAARRAMFLDERGEPDDRSLTGHLASGVPGSVAGLWEAHRRLGTKPWAALVEPAIALARDGFEIDADFAAEVRGDAERLARFPASAALFLPGGQPVAQGQRFRNTELARTLERIAKSGPRGFYEGPTADALVAEMERGHGILTRDDLAGYTAKWREPLAFPYRGKRVIGMPPPSSGGVALALIAGQLASTDLGRLGFRTPSAIHREVEAFRRAFAVRNSVLGDPDFVDVPLAHLLEPDFATELARSIDPDHATPSERVAPGVGADVEGRHTTHFSIADAHGNVAALTTTLNDSFGSAVTVAGGGFLLNNEMDDFAAKPGAPNLFGLVQGEANAIAPGKRMLSSMTPTIVLDERGEPLLVTGASGGPRIITATFLILSARIDHGLGIVAAASAPRFHHQHLPDVIAIEKAGLDEETVRALETMGHKIRWVDPTATSLAATIERRDGHWYGVSDPRTHGLALGF
jgi:gamma-glutamyltranspeptidase/glutathione hydrolase